MSISIIVPRLGWSMDEGTFSRWLKQEGDIVNAGDAVFEVESDKATQEVESFDQGILRLLPNAPQPGDTVRVGQVLGYLCAVGEPAPLGPAEQLPTSNHASNSSPQGGVQHDRRISSAVAGTEEAVDSSVRSTNGEVRTVNDPQLPHLDDERMPPIDRSSNPSPRVSPRAARLSIETQVDLRNVTGTGRLGRIREKDVLAAHASRLSFPSQSSVTNSSASPSVGLPRKNVEASSNDSVRRATANRMLTSVQQTAQITLSAQADATNLASFREQMQDVTPAPGILVPTFSDFFIKLCAAALERHPSLMHQWTDSGIFVPDELHIAVAVNTPHGLYAPVIRNVPSLSLLQISGQLRDLAARAANRQLLPDESAGGVFTVTNLGRYRIDVFTPILNMPQTAILGVGRIAPAPTVIGSNIAIRKMVTLSLTFDHRVVDGAPAAAFLTTICELVERPIQWLLP